MLTRFRRHVAPLDRRGNGGKTPASGGGTPTEDVRFDAFAKTFGTVTSRRQTLGALLGGALVLHGFAGAAAKKGKKKEGKTPWCHCPNGNPDKCVTVKLGKRARKRHKQNHPFDYPGKCQKPEQEQEQEPSCPPGQTNCSGVCKDVQTDETNCGTCGNTCGAGQICCSGVCKNVNTDESNCGTCGNICGAGLTCCSGVCKNLQADPTNCGACSNTCAAPANFCLAGDCCRLPSVPCTAASQCCTNVCLPPTMALPFPHCA